MTAAKAAGTSTPNRNIKSGTSTPSRVEAPTFVPQSWQQVDPLKNQVDAGDEWAEAEGAEEFECVACRKTFRSEAAWASHERSKKHLKEMDRLRREMLEENEVLGLGEDGKDDSDVAEEFASAGEEVEPPASPAVEDAEEVSPESETKQTHSLQVNDQLLSEDEALRRPKSRRKRGGKSNTATPRETSPVRSSRAEVRLTGNISFVSDAVGSDDGSNVDADVDSKAPDNAKPELSKRDKRRAREAAKKAKEEEAKGNPSTQETCNICKESFTSRTKLFAHIKESGHALAVPVSDDDRRAQARDSNVKKSAKGKKR